MILKEVQQNLIHIYPFAWDGTSLNKPSRKKANFTKPAANTDNTAP